MRPCANAEITSAPGSTYEFPEVWLFHHIVIIDNMMFKPNVKQNTKATQKQTQQHRPAGLRGRGQGVRHRHGESFIRLLGSLTKNPKRSCSAEKGV